jgi:hypothetical protein
MSETLYICVASFSGYYFGIGGTKQQAYEDVCSKWEYDGAGGKSITSCIFFKVSEISH